MFVGRDWRTVPLFPGCPCGKRGCSWCLGHCAWHFYEKVVYNIFKNRPDKHCLGWFQIGTGLPWALGWTKWPSRSPNLKKKRRGGEELNRAGSASCLIAGEIVAVMSGFFTVEQFKFFVKTFESFLWKTKKFQGGRKSATFEFCQKSTFPSVKISEKFWPAKSFLCYKTTKRILRCSLSHSVIRGLFVVMGRVNYFYCRGTQRHLSVSEPQHRPCTEQETAFPRVYRWHETC